MLNPIGLVKEIVFLILGSKEVIFLIAIFIVSFFVHRYGPIVLLYFASFFFWHTMTLNSWGPLDTILQRMTPSDIAIVWAFLYSIFFIKRGRIPFLKYLIIFLISSIIPWLFGVIPDKHFAWIAMRQSVILPIMAYIATVKIVRNEKELKNLIWFFLGGTALISLISVMAALGYFGSPFTGPHVDLLDPGFRLFSHYKVPIFGHLTLGGNITPVYAAYALPFFVTLLMIRLKLINWLTLFLLFGFGVNLMAILVSGSRTPFIAVIISAVLIYLLILKRNPITKTGKGVIVGFMSIMVFVLLKHLGLLSIAIIDRIASLSYALHSPYVYLYETGGDRGIIWEEFIPTMMNYPFGAGFMESFAPIGGVDLGPHAQYLLLLLGTGFVGMIIYFLFVFLCMWKGFSTKPLNDRLDWIKIGCGGAILTYFFSAFMVHTILVHGADWLLFILCGISIKKLPMPESPINRKRLIIRW